MNSERRQNEVLNFGKPYKIHKTSEPKGRVRMGCELLEGELKYLGSVIGKHDMMVG